MKNDPKKALGNSSDYCPSLKDIQDYFDEKMNVNQEHQLEQKLQDCPHPACKCQEMLEGMEMVQEANDIINNEPEYANDFKPEPLLQTIKEMIEERERAMAKSSSVLETSKLPHSQRKFRFLPRLTALIAVILLLAIFLTQFYNKPISEPKSPGLENSEPPNIVNTLKAENHDQTPAKIHQDAKVSSPDQQSNPQNNAAYLAFDPNPQLEALVSKTTRGTSPKNRLS
ncbi:MAG: hypothetical protein HC880_19420 [Bacteroidia bacterium]|nr:hypothetical protein [Bacteroidia bacterium]